MDREKPTVIYAVRYDVGDEGPMLMDSVWTAREPAERRREAMLRAALHWSAHHVVVEQWPLDTPQGVRN